MFLEKKRRQAEKVFMSSCVIGSDDDLCSLKQANVRSFSRHHHGDGINLMENLRQDMKQFDTVKF